MEHKGITSTSWHIDRIEPTKGYSKDNIQPLPNIDNVRKYIAWKDRDENGNNIFETITVKPIVDNYDSCPF